MYGIVIKCITYMKVVKKVDLKCSDNKKRNVII